MEKDTSKKIAVALKYDMGQEAPEIVATGKGLLAEKIVNEAKEYDVPTYEDKRLAKTLSSLEIGDMIPPELYGVVAEILVFVDSIERKAKRMEEMNNK